MATAKLVVTDVKVTKGGRFNVELNGAMHITGKVKTTKGGGHVISTNASFKRDYVRDNITSSVISAFRALKEGK